MHAQILLNLLLQRTNAIFLRIRGSTGMVEGWVDWSLGGIQGVHRATYKFTNPSIFFVVSLPFFLRSVILSSFLLYFTGGSWQTFCPNKNPSCARLIFEKLKMLKGRCLRVVSFLFFSFSLLFRCVR